MKKNMPKLPNSDRKRRISLMLIFTMLFSTFMYEGWYEPKKAEAAITSLQAWSNVYHGTATTAQNISYTVPAGSGTNRVLVVAISTTRTTVGSRTVTLTYGGQTLTSIAGDMATTTIQQHTQLYYLNEAGLDAASNTTLSVTVSGGTTRMTDVFAAVFDGVDQTTPITDSKTYNSGTTQSAGPHAFGTALTVNANDQAVEIINCTRLASTILRTITYATNWTMQQQQTSTTTDAIRNAVANRSIPGSDTTDTSSTTFNGTALASMTGMSLKAFTCSDTDPATLTISDPTSGTSVMGIKTVQVTVGGSEPAGNMTGMNITIAGSTACNVTAAAMTLNGSVWEYSWNTSACGTSVAETGITIDVNGTDPDCGGSTKNAPQVNNITINNADPSKIKSCGGCHAYPPLDGARSGATGAVVGDHQVHPYTCSTCHVAPATETSADFGHRDGNITMQSNIRGGSYNKVSPFPQVNSPSPVACNNVGCHGAGNTPVWGTGTVTCQNCHTNAVDAGDGGTPPGRRAVIAEFQNNAIGHLQYNVASAANATLRSDCSKCHAEPVASHIDNTLNNGRSAGTFGDATFCLDCHKSGATNNSFSTQSRTSPDIDGSGWTTGTTVKSGTGLVLGMTSHRAAAVCTDCHGDGAGNARVHGGTVNNLMKQSSQYATCFSGTSTACHGSSSTIANTGAQIGKAASATGGIHPIFGAAVPLANIKSAIMRTRTTLNTTNATDGHDDLFVRGWSATSTMVCSDCHSQNGTSGVRGPHGSAYGYILKGLDNTAVPSATSTRSLGSPYVSGVLTVDANNQENICLNCHAADIYGDGRGTAAANDTIDTAGHTKSWRNSGTSACGASANNGTLSALINCLNCHAGSDPAGGYGAHGSTRAVSTAGQTFSSGYTTQSTGFINGDSWTQAPDSTNGCYATNNATNWSACGQGTHN